MANITHDSPVVTEDKLKDFYEDIKPFLGCPTYVTQEGDSEYYSTDEKVVGRWTDGKPLYQKFIDLGVLTNNKTVNHNIANIDTIADVQGMAYNSSGQFLKLSFINLSNSYYGSLIVDKTKISILTSGITDRSGFVILQYTKTTDSAATTIEQKPTHYSTSEQVVGTWIDGKPIYQKTINFGTLGNATKKAVAHNISNLKAVVSFKASAWGTTGGVYYAFIIPNVGTNNQYTYDIAIDITGANIDITTQTDRTWLTAQVTLQYTKTTD